MKGKPQSVEAYIAERPIATQARLEELRRYLKLADPSATDTLKWGKPALVNDGILFVYAGFASHVSLHPTPSVVQAFAQELRAFKVTQNTIQFSVLEPIPQELVCRIAQLRVYEKTEQNVGWK